MRRKRRNTIHLLFIIILIAFVLIIVSLVILLFMVSPWQEDIGIGSDSIMTHLEQTDGSYRLSDGMQDLLREKNLFAMMINEDGDVIWEEGMPEELDRSYTMQDVARFTRYYLDDYPVHTYVVPEGLLLIGGQKDTTWKYTFEYNIDMLRQLFRRIPLFLLADIAILIAVPLFLQKKWIRQREEERTEWIAGISHDIRTPLTLILGNAGQLSQQSNDPAVRGKAAVIEEQTLRIRSLVANLNMSSKLGYGIDLYQKEELRICEILRKVLSEIINRMPEERCSLSLNIPNDLKDITIHANKDLFVRLIENLINNSIRHNPDGCHIEVRLEQPQKKHRHCILTIADNGTGVGTDKLRELNQKFSAALEITGEHGLGLRLVKEISAYHAWEIEFRNRTPQGFECRIQL